MSIDTVADTLAADGDRAVALDMDRQNGFTTT